MMETWHDGFEMSRELRADARSSEMPILMLTSIEESTGIESKRTRLVEWLCHVRSVTVL